MFELVKEPIGSLTTRLALRSGASLPACGGQF